MMSYLEMAERRLAELRARKGDVLQALRLGPLARYAVEELGLRVVASRRYPLVHTTLRETADTGGDGALLRHLHAALQASPGQDRIMLTVRTLSGQVQRLHWRAGVTPALRSALGWLLRERALALGLVVDRRAFTCRRCGGDELAYDPDGRLFCHPCHLRGWRRGQAVG